MKSNSKDIDNIIIPSNFSIKFANTVFLFVIFISGLIGLFAVFKIYNLPEIIPLTFYYSCILFSVLTATFFLIGLKGLTDELKEKLSVLIVTIGIMLYGFEIYLITQVDQRTKMEVLDDLIDSGINAYPNVNPDYLVKNASTKNGFISKGGGIFPLGGISNQMMVQKNENGYWMMYVGDRYGFHNENYVYNQNIIDIVMTGDSFTEGWSVKSEENIGAVLQKFGFKVVNIGKAGNGSLIELAAIKEYAEQLKPKIVLWIYFINDLIDLSYEIKSLILNKYLNDDGFSQNLISRQNEIDSVLINHVQFEWNKERERKRENESWINNWVIRILKLWNLRVRINLIPIPTTTSYPTSYPTYSTRPVFIDILKRSKQMVSRWGGEMYFVYLPDIYRYSTGNENPNREFVLQTVTELGIPIIDIHREVFNIHPDPMSLFPFRLNSHYNAEGYKLVAEAIGKRLEADGISPSNDNN